jgi:hypothetical protein
MNWSTRYAREAIYKQAHFEDVGHPVPGNLEELADHIISHHPEVGNNHERIREVLRDAARDHPEWNQRVIDHHLTSTHPNGTRAGDHPHVHGEETETNIEVPDTVDAISTNYISI